MNILSLFDGISCGRLAFEMSEIKVNKYYASEIYNKAIEISDKNWDDITQIGDVKNINKEFIMSLPKIDIIIGGFPCKNLSITVANNNNHNQGLRGEYSSLFYDFYNILRWIRKYNNKDVLFLIENVASMKDDDKDIITKLLDINPVMIDSALLTAQDRKRYYWTNINNGIIEQPKDTGVVLKDIMEDSKDINKKYWYKQDYEYHGDKKVCGTLNINGHDILKRIYHQDYKCGTLTAVVGGNQHKKVLQDGVPRKLTPIEYERLQGVSDNYTKGFSDSVRYKTLGDGWTIPVISHILNYLK